MEPELTVDAVRALHDRGEIQLIDVRTPREHEAGRITDDVHIELSELSERQGEVDRERPVVFYCKTGARSGMASAAFRAAGYDASNMTGGLKDWEAAGLPLEPDGAVVAD
jgi:rhodanese-related sulfurtransferase